MPSASCLIYAQRSQYTFRWQPARISLRIWVRAFIKPDLIDHSVPFNDTTPYLSDQSALQIRVINLG